MITKRNEVRSIAPGGHGRQPIRDAALPILLALALTACSPRTPDDAKARSAESAPQPVASSSLGAFLAGRFAQVNGDTRAAADYFTSALAFDPENAELLQRAFTLQVAEGRLDQAIPLAQRLLEFDADAPIPTLVMGVREAREGRFAAAEQRFGLLPRKGVTSFLGPLLTAWARAGQGRTDHALEALAPLSGMSGLAPFYEFHAGLINDLGERPKAAEQHYRTALAGQVSVRTIEAAGALYQRSGRMDEARALYTRYHSEHPERTLFDGEARLALGQALARPVGSPLGGMAEALFDTAALLRQGNALDLSMVFARLTLALEPDFPLARILLGEVLAQQKRFDESSALFRSLDPASPAGGFAYLKAAINLDDAGDAEGALAALKDIAKARPEGVDALVAMGDVLRRRQRFAEAVGAYDQAVARVQRRIEARHWVLYYSRGISLERSQQWNRAEADFQTALKLKPDQPDVLNYLGYSWVDRGIRLDDGRRLIERAVELRPRDGAIVDSLGWALYRLGEFQAAVKHLERAVELKPEDATINDHLGDALWQVGRAEEARFQWQRALTLDPEQDLLEILRRKVETGEPPALPVAK